MSKPVTPTYKTKYWPDYNAALEKRGSLTFWFDPDMLWKAKPAGKRGRQQAYSDAAIQTCLTIARHVIVQQRQRGDEGAVRHGAATNDPVRCKPLGADRPGLGCADFSMLCRSQGAGTLTRRLGLRRIVAVE